MVVYDNYTTVEGVERVKAYSDKAVCIERDGEKYSEAIDPSEFGRIYTETAIPIEGEDELTVADALEVLNEFGVDTDDN